MRASFRLLISAGAALAVSGCSGVNVPTESRYAPLEATMAVIGGSVDDAVGSGEWTTMDGSSSCTRVGSCEARLTNEIQRVSFDSDPTAGTFDLDFGASAATIDFDDTAAEVDSKLEAVLGANTLSVSGTITSSEGLIVEFIGTQAGIDAAAMNLDDAALVGANASITTEQDGASNFSVEVLTHDSCGDGTNELNGEIELVYVGNAGSDCDWDVGETVFRTGSTSLFGLVAGTFVGTTLNSSNYLNEVVGGGVYLTKLSSSAFRLNIIGSKVRRALRNGTQDYDVTLYSTSDLVISGTGDRASRSVSGTVVANHNDSLFSVEYVLSNVTWSADCALPSGGSVTATYSGTLTGTETVTFNGCGSGSDVSLRFSL